MNIALPDRGTTALAGRLRICPARFFHSLETFEQCGLLVRAKGAALFRRTQFGHFLDECGVGRRISDLLSGLGVDVDEVEAVFILSGGNEPPCFEVQCRGLGFPLAIFPGTGPADRQWLLQLAEQVGPQRPSLQSLRDLGARCWMDEPVPARGAADWQISLERFRLDPHGLSVEFRSRALSFSCRLEIGNADRSSGAGKFWDPSNGTVLYLHTQTLLRRFDEAWPTSHGEGRKARAI